MLKLNNNMKISCHFLYNKYDPSLYFTLNVTNTFKYARIYYNKIIVTDLRKFNHQLLILRFFFYRSILFNDSSRIFLKKNKIIKFK